MINRLHIKRVKRKRKLEARYACHGSVYSCMRVHVLPSLIRKMQKEHMEKQRQKFKLQKEMPAQKKGFFKKLIERFR